MHHSYGHLRLDRVTIFSYGHCEKRGDDSSRRSLGEVGSNPASRFDQLKAPSPSWGWIVTPAVGELAMIKKSVMNAAQQTAQLTIDP